MTRHFNDTTIAKTKRIIGPSVQCTKASVKSSKQDGINITTASHLTSCPSTDRRTRAAPQKRHYSDSEDPDSPQRKKGSIGPLNTLMENTTNKLAPQKRSLEKINSDRLKSAQHDS